MKKICKLIIRISACAGIVALIGEIFRSFREKSVSKSKGIYEKYLKRFWDVAISTAVLIFFFPLIVIISFLVRINIGRPVLFVQDRPGKGGKIFKIYKFRTMTNEIDNTGLLLSDDYRLTSFGRVLRSTSLDELPELFNIIKGDMSIVGPRPLLVRYLTRYNAHQARRHEVRPGLTGLAQVHGRNDIDWKEKLDWDVLYVDNISFLEDIKIIISTIKVVLKREGISSKNSATTEEFENNDDEGTGI